MKIQNKSQMVERIQSDQNVMAPQQPTHAS